MASAYPTNNPPSYGATPSKPFRDEEIETTQPLLFHDESNAGAGPSHRNGIYNQPDDLPDDFKVYI
jgi:hypothetical protein